MKSYFFLFFNKPLIQEARDTRSDFWSKAKSSKASTGMYQTCQLPARGGLVSMNPWLTHMNRWLKPREKRAAKRKMICSLNLSRRSLTKKAMVSGVYAGKSYIKFGRMIPGVKPRPKGSVSRSWYGTPETLHPFKGGRGEIGTKRALRVMPERDRISVNPKGCPLPMTSRLEDSQVIYP
ncbi:MAG: hypothetical protein GF383_01540 [Candidatus Lokiarchaeota archaeon]|nr:hypothetical protein [Candidatus Lokiarchaeota archaeon]